MKKILPPLCFVAAIGGMIACHIALPIWRWIAFPWTLIGIAPIVAGAVLSLAGGWTFRRHGTTVRPFSRSSALVTDGLYRFSRNPMYVGMVLDLVGVAVLMGTASPWAVVVGFAALFDRVFVRREEAMLEAAFGARFVEYRKRVRRWL